eukprot:GHVU01017631.1.p2 GENE.GHVU01017631.1~~GHVU01017631.1.p2  ORF type:complete len:386 (+),score=53.18 GHVU01017631.1:223-1380(+)
MWLVAACVRGCLRTCRCARVCAAVCVRACVRGCGCSNAALLLPISVADGGTAAADTTCHAGADAASESGGAAAATAEGIGAAAQGGRGAAASSSAEDAAFVGADAARADATAAHDDDGDSDCGTDTGLVGNKRSRQQEIDELDDEGGNERGGEEEEEAPPARNKRRVVFDWGEPIRTYTLGTWTLNRAAAKKTIQDSREGKFRWVGASTLDQQQSVRYRCRAHETPEGQPCNAWMMYKGGPSGPVHLHAMGTHASERVPDACGLGYEFRAEAQSRRGPTKAPARTVTNSFELDVERQSLPVATAPSVAAMRNFFKTVSRRERGGHNTNMMLAEVNEWASTHPAPRTAEEFDALPPLQVIVFHNAMEEGLGIVFGNRAVRVHWFPR